MKTKNTRNNTLLSLLGLALLGTAPAGAQVKQLLFEPVTGTRDDYSGVVGYVFKVGSSNVVVSHLGTYDSNGDGLVLQHHAGIFTADGSSLLGSITNSSGTGDYLTNDVRWVQLNPPLMLSANTTYLVGGDVFSGSGDPWADFYTDAWTPTWNTYFIGTNDPATTTRLRYTGSGEVWPTPPLGTWGSAPQAYGNVHVGYLEVGPARADVQTTNVSAAVGGNVTVVGFGTGQAPISYQWFKSPGTILPAQTNATLNLASVTLGETGTYYLTATNALGGAQSRNVTLTVSAVPASITQQPVNQSVPALFPVTFSVTAGGTPPLYYQWLRNGSPVAGATSASYQFNPALENNGDVYACIASNYFGGTPYTAISSNATLTVIANLAQPTNFLHGARANTATNNWQGTVGGVFTTGPNESLVTHLGYYASQFTDANHASLTVDHHVGIFSANGSTLIASAVVSNGINEVINGYMWAALDAPIMLTSNTTYLLAAEVFSGIDPWGDAYVVPDMNDHFVGVNGNTANAVRYGAAAWPDPPLSTFTLGGALYSAPNLAALPIGTAAAWVSPTAVTQYVGFEVTFTGEANGQAPVTAQWYKVGTPDTALPGQTNLPLTLSNLTLADSGDYYLEARNALGTNQSAHVTLTVLPTTAPTVTLDPVSQTVFVHQTVTFQGSAEGTPPLSYQWTFGGNPIPDATNTSLVLTDVSTADAGNYRLTVTSPYGSTNSAVATLSVVTPAWGSYPSAVMGPDLLVYYRFDDVSTGVATNMGALGFANNGTYEPVGFVYSGTGPTGPNFEPGNPSAGLDGTFTDVAIPSMGVTVSNCTVAVWVYKALDQFDNAAIYYHRGSAVFGLSITDDDGTGPGTLPDTLRYTWGGTHWAFQTGLVLPTNQWALVAMSVTPTNATIHLHDGTTLQSTNNAAAHATAVLDATSYVGWDTAGGDTGRRWWGEVDELMIFDRALSAVEVNALYLGVPGSATLDITRSGSNVILNWPGGTLLEANEVSGPWTTNAATSPYSVPAAAAKKFYRVQLQP